MNARFVMGLALGFAIGLACRVLGVPVPAPTALAGALLVLALTSGYVLADRFIVRRKATQKSHCAGPTGG
jgi:XapX domain-containing protein